MAPVTKIRSIRLHNDRWAEIEAYAEKRGLSVNAAVAELVEAGLGGSEAKAPVKPKTRPAEHIAAGLKDAIEIAQGRADPKTYRVHQVQVERPKPRLSVAVPLASEVVRKPYQKGQKK